MVINGQATVHVDEVTTADDIDCARIMDPLFCSSTCP